MEGSYNFLENILKYLKKQIYNNPFFQWFSISSEQWIYFGALFYISGDGIIDEPYVTVKIFELC